MEGSLPKLCFPALAMLPPTPTPRPFLSGHLCVLVYKMELGTPVLPQGSPDDALIKETGEM